MNHDLPVINSHNGWSQLEETWLGDVYPASWYDNLTPEVRDVFYQLTEITKQDLATIQHTLEALGVTVRRPVYNKIEDFLQADEQLTKPQICPRDNFLTVGNTLLCHWWHKTAWETHLQEYEKDTRSRVKINPDVHVMNGANVVRVGRDIIIDRDHYEFEYQNQFIDPQYRVQVVANGGHMDGCFTILKPGLILANHYYNDYEKTFPGWEIIMLDNPTYNAAPYTGNPQPYPVYNGKFWNTSVGTNRRFNDHIINHALDWVGCYTETYFELNCLVVNESNVIMLAENETLANTLSQHGITVHWVPFRTRSFWDGAMHCLTLDVRRQSTVEDFFPERG